MKFEIGKSYWHERRQELLTITGKRPLDFESYNEFYYKSNRENIMQVFGEDSGFANELVEVDHDIARLLYL
jgi:hypothetical protein